MNAAETGKLIAILKAAYPRQPVEDATASVYATMLEDLDPRAAVEAVQRHIATCTYFPSIAEIRKGAAEKSCGAPTAAEAWDEVLRAVSRYGRNRAPKWSHVAVENAVNGVGWQAICDSSDQMADRAHFFKLYSETRTAAVTEENVRPMLEQAERRALKAQSVGDVLKALPGGKR